MWLIRLFVTSFFFRRKGAIFLFFPSFFKAFYKFFKKISSLSKEEMKLLPFIIGILLVLVLEKLCRILYPTSILRISTVLSPIAELSSNFFYNAGNTFAFLMAKIASIFVSANSDLSNLFGPIFSILFSWIKSIYGVSDFINFVTDKYTILLGVVIFFIFIFIVIFKIKRNN